jgi:hypothetical protein
MLCYVYVTPGPAAGASAIPGWPGAASGEMAAEQHSPPQPSRYLHVSRVALDESSAVVSCSERAHILANRVQFSRTYATIYFSALLLSLLLFVWVIVESHTHSRSYLQAHFYLFVAADACVTAVVIAEITIAAVGQGRQRFCSSTSNVLDVLVALFCIFVLLLHVLGPSVMAKMGNVTAANLGPTLVQEEIEQEEVETVVLALRYAAQISRLYVMLRHFRRQQESCMRRREVEMCLDSPKMDRTEPDYVEPDGTELMTQRGSDEPLPSAPLPESCIGSGGQCT